MGRRITMILIMAISVIVLVASLVGVVGVWVVRGDVVQVVNDVASVAETALQRGIDGASRVNSQVDDTRQVIQKINGLISTIGDKVQETNLILTAIEQITNKDLSPAIDKLNTGGADLLARINQAQSTIDMLNKLPPFRGQNGALDKASAVLDEIQTVAQSVADLRQTLQAGKDTITKNTVAILTTPLGRIDNIMASVQKDIAAIQQALSGAQARIPVVQSQVIFWLNLAAIILTLLLLWIALSQVSLFIQARSIYRHKETQAALPQPTDSSQAVVSAEQSAVRESAAPAEDQKPSESSDLEQGKPEQSTSDQGNVDQEPNEPGTTGQVKSP